MHKHQGLIDKELLRISDGSFGFQMFKPTNRNIDRLFSQYYVEEGCECFFDDWPEDPSTVTWYDPIGEGIWYKSQYWVDRQAKLIMKEVRSKASRNGRFYIGYDHKYEILHIFWFGRDLSPNADYWWSMKKRRKK